MKKTLVLAGIAIILTAIYSLMPQQASSFNPDKFNVTCILGENCDNSVTWTATLRYYNGRSTGYTCQIPPGGTSCTVTVTGIPAGEALYWEITSSVGDYKSDYFGLMDISVTVNCSGPNKIKK